MLSLLYLSLSVLAVCVGLLAAAVAVALLRLTAPSGKGSLAADLGLAKEGPSLSDIPKPLASWIAEESEVWAQRDLQQRALALKRSGKDWVEVEAELRQMAAGEPTLYQGF